MVEVGTRRRSHDEREADLAEALAFARLHLAAAPAAPARAPSWAPHEPRGDADRPGVDTAAGDRRGRAGASSPSHGLRRRRSLRGIARRAGVDPALVHHYFDGKAQLFAGRAGLPADPADADQRRGRAARATRWARRWSRTFLAVWDSPDGRQRFQALMRAAVSHEEATRMLREFLTREVFGRVPRRARRRSPDRASCGPGWRRPRWSVWR